MLKKTDNYEEAKLIFKNSVGDEYDKHFIRSNKIKGALITSLSVLLAAGYGIFTSNPVAALTLLPGVGAVAFAAYSPIRAFKEKNEAIKSGKFFEERTQQELIDAANNYVDLYNGKFPDNNVKEKGKSK